MAAVTSLKEDTEAPSNLLAGSAVFGDQLTELNGADPPRRWFTLCGIFLVVTFFSWLGVGIAKHSGGVATIWFSNGIIFALVIRQPRSLWPLYFALEFAADVLADQIYGDPLLTNLGVGLCNAFEVFLTAALMTRWFGVPVRLSRTRPLLAFLGTGVLAVPMISCAAASACLAAYEHTGWSWLTWRTWYLGDLLGMAILVPLVYLLQEPDVFSILRPGQLPTTLLVLTVPAILTAIDFWQTKEVTVFFMLPSLLFVVFRLGLRGAVLATLVIAGIALSLTLAGRGPLSLIASTGMLHRIVIVQVLIAVALLTAFPVATLLEEHRGLECSLQQSEARFRALANTDALTGQANRRAFNERLEHEWQSAVAHGGLLALLAIDVDLFKKYNDIYGHIAGDDCLRRIATTASEALHQHTSARLYRLGGEEFAVLLSPGDAPEAFALAEQIRRAVLAEAIAHEGSPSGVQTISIGVASIHPDTSGPPMSLLDLADQALYRAKANGRNRSEAA